MTGGSAVVVGAAVTQLSSTSSSSALFTYRNGPLPWSRSRCPLCSRNEQMSYIMPEPSSCGRYSPRTRTMNVGTRSLFRLYLGGEAG